MNLNKQMIRDMALRNYFALFIITQCDQGFVYICTNIVSNCKGHTIWVKGVLEIKNSFFFDNDDSYFYMSTQSSSISLFNCNTDKTSRSTTGTFTIENATTIINNLTFIQFDQCFRIHIDQITKQKLDATFHYLFPMFYLVD